MEGVEPSPEKRCAGGIPAETLQTVRAADPRSKYFSAQFGSLAALAPWIDSLLVPAMLDERHNCYPGRVPAWRAIVRRDDLCWSISAAGLRSVLSPSWSNGNMSGLRQNNSGAAFFGVVAGAGWAC